MALSDWVVSIMEQLGYIGIIVLMFLDNIFPPLPSEIIMPSAGYAASQGDLTLLGVIIAGSIGSLIAAASLYWLGRKIPREQMLNWVDHYGKFLRIHSSDVERSLAWFEKYGHRIVFFGRMIPAVRSLISIPAGMSRMPFAKFMLYSTFGTVVWTSFLACVGFYFGENKVLMHAILQHTAYVILGMILVFIVWRVIKRYFRSH